MDWWLAGCLAGWRDVWIFDYIIPFSCLSPGFNGWSGVEWAFYFKILNITTGRAIVLAEEWAEHSSMGFHHMNSHTFASQSTFLTFFSYFALAFHWCSFDTCCEQALFCISLMTYMNKSIPAEMDSRTSWPLSFSIIPTYSRICLKALVKFGCAAHFVNISHQL